jgi:hypothetical protein
MFSFWYFEKIHYPTGVVVVNSEVVGFSSCVVTPVVGLYPFRLQEDTNVYRHAYIVKDHISAKMFDDST